MRAATPLLVLAVVVGVVRAVRRQGPTRTVELRFRPPTGHDPAAALAALHRAGFAAGPAVAHGSAEIVITCAATERERVRTTLRNAPGNMAGDDLGGGGVRFVDEG